MQSISAELLQTLTNRKRPLGIDPDGHHFLISERPIGGQATILAS
jgi:hypothetical protein